MLASRASKSWSISQLFSPVLSVSCKHAVPQDVQSANITLFTCSAVCEHCIVMVMLQEEMLKEATSIVDERRGPEIAALRTEPGRQGVFAWAGGPPRAGQRAVLAYNKAHGPLRWA
jgi:hypothetical protein